MSVDIATVKRIASLARIAVSDEEAAALQGELSAILRWAEQLSEVDIADVPAMTGGVEARMTWRDDVVAEGGIADEVLANAPETEDGYFVVPRVVE